MKYNSPRILIVKLSAIGDVIHTLPALNAIRRHYPDAHITWLVEEAAADLVVGHDALDRVLVSRRKTWIRQLKTAHRRIALREMMAFLAALRDTRYDMILDFQALLKSGLLIGLARGGRKIGFGPGMEHQEHSYWFLNERIPAVSMEIHALTRGLRMLEAIGIPAEAVEYRLPVSDTDRRTADNLLGGHPDNSSGPLVAINPMAKWPSKLWEGKRFGQVADRLIDEWGARVVFTGGPEDRADIEGILAGMSNPALNAAGCTSLKELAALYERMQCLITTDTGPMHLAAAADLPVVALFGPTAPWRTGPFGDRHVVVRSEEPCSPCFERVCEDHRCMQRISVDQVLDGVTRIGLDRS